MPMYTYSCNCGCEFEIEQSIKAEKGADCPECGGRTVMRLIAPSTFVLRGDGWAKDGYAGSKKDA
jgi:putative FmdB family regulatory protein